MSQDSLLTIDVDWAPDWAIASVREFLQAAGVRATWFVTHDSPEVRHLLAEASLFEVGWHPNFLPGSTQGGSPEEVLAYCAALAPHARAMRTHGLFQSTPLLAQVRASTMIRIDSSQVLLGQPSLRAHAFPTPAGPMWRIPIWWEDDLESLQPVPDYALGFRLTTASPGVRVLNFHPIHIVLDSFSGATYRALKQGTPALTALTRDAVRRVRSDAGPLRGAGRAFREVVHQLAALGGGETLSAHLARVCPAAGALWT